MTFSIPDEQAVFSGDVLFQGSVGRIDLPGGDWPTLLESIRTLVDTLPEETAVYPGHMGADHARRRARDQPVPGRAGQVAAMAGKLQAPRGTFDVLPEDGRAPRRAARGQPTSCSGRAGYEPFETPVFEDTELFARGVGESTDIVQKEMFTFEDKGGRSLTLRPEGTAGVCRAYVEHGMHKLPQPVKLWYWGPFFRHEAPQAGRYRQFTQVGAEALGSDDPSLDAELILLLAELLERRRGGRAGCACPAWATPTPAPPTARSCAPTCARARASCPTRCARASTPTRCARSTPTTPGTQAVMADAPLLIDRLDPEDAEHFAEVRALLDDAGLAYELDPTLVRGLDYYTRTVFEFESAALGAQSGVGGGGRYDGLVEQLGGPPTPGVGWAAGIERILLAGSPAEELALPVAYVAVADAEQRRTAFALAEALRGAGRARRDGAGRPLA